MKKGKEKLALELENEEEFISNNLQRKLSIVKLEKEQKAAEVELL